MNSSSIIPYSFIGITTIILGYYTFFEKDIETAELPESPSVIPSVTPSVIPSVMPSVIPSVIPSVMPEQQQQGGKHKKTQKHKKIKNKGQSKRNTGKGH
jgi:hypothetical protein